MLLAYEKGADLIVAVGTHFNLIEFLERNRAGMSSTFLTRLKVGEILVDARGVSRLFRQRAGVWPLVAFGVAALGVVVAAIASSPGLRDFISALVDRLPHSRRPRHEGRGARVAPRAAGGRLEAPRRAVPPAGLVARLPGRRA